MTSHDACYCGIFPASTLTAQALRSPPHLERSLQTSGTEGLTDHCGVSSLALRIDPRHRACIVYGWKAPLCAGERRAEITSARPEF